MKGFSGTSMKASNPLLWGVFVVINLFVSSFAAYSATYYSRVASGSFATVSSWSTSPTGTPTNATALAATDVFIIQNGHTINVAANITVAGITINSGGTLTSSASIVLTVNGPWVDNGTFTPSSGTVTFGGANAAVNVGTGSANFNNIIVSSGAAFVINNPMTVAGTFNYAATAANTSVTISGSNTLSVTGAMTMTRPNAGLTATLAVGAGSLTVGGLFTMAATTSGRNDVLSISTGTVNLGAITTGTTGCLITFTGAGTLNISGAASTGPPAITPSTGTVNFSGAAAQTVWPETYNNLTLSGGGIKTTASITVGGILSMEGTATASAAPTYGANATLRYNTSTSRTVGAEWLATTAATGGVIIDNTGAIITNGNKVFNLDIPLTINSGATLSPAAGNTFSFGGDLINNGAWTASTGAVTITLARTTQTIGRFNTTGLVTMSKASGTATFAGNINGGAFTMNGAGTLNLGAGFTHVFTGAWTNTAGILQGNTSTLEIGGTGSGTGVTFTANTSTVDFEGAGAQNIPAFTYHNLKTTTGGTKTLLGNTTVNGELTINSGSTFATGAFTLNLTGSGTPLVDNGTFTASAGSTVIYSNATASIAPETYVNLQTSTVGTKTMSGNTTVSGVLTVNSGTFATGAFTLTLSGTGTPLVDNGTFTASPGSTVIYSNATANIAPETYVNLQTSTVGTKTMLGNTTVTGVLTISSGTFNTGAFTLTLSGTGSPLVDNGTFTAAAGSTVLYSGSTATIAGETYVNLQTSTGTLTLGNNTTVSGVLTIVSGTLDLSNRILTLTGASNPLVATGTFTASTSKVIYSTGAQNIALLNYYDLDCPAGAKTYPAGTIGIAGTFNPTGSTQTVDNANIINFNGAGPSQPITGGFPFKKVILSGSGQKVISTTVGVKEVEIQDGPTMDITTGQLDIN